MAQFYKLKAGSFTVGNAPNASYYVASDPLRNVVESEFDLAAEFPEKFEEYKGPSGQRSPRARAPLPPPPPPPGPAEFQEAEILSVRTAGEAQVRAQRLREMADQLEAIAKASAEEQGLEQQTSQHGQEAEEQRKGMETAHEDQVEGQRQAQEALDEDIELTAMSDDSLKQRAEELELDVPENAGRNTIIEAIRAERKKTEE
jgi:type IV secretory pathway VirB10-like protein